MSILTQGRYRRYTRSMLERSGKRRPPDSDELIDVIESASSDDTPKANAPVKNPAAVALGRLGGRKGGKARAAKLSAERRTEIARKAAQARWRDRG